MSELLLGRARISLKAAQIMNEDMRAAQTAHPDRIRWFASLPWQYADLALAELDRAAAAGVTGRVQGVGFRWFARDRPSPLA